MQGAAQGLRDDCSIRPCLQWIKSPESQANATIFLSKFYGRAGLINLINSGAEDLRPAIFRSLLYEACGRLVNPMYGSVGLLWSGSWHLCQAAVEAVLKGPHHSGLLRGRRPKTRGLLPRGRDLFLRHPPRLQGGHSLAPIWPGRGGWPRRCLPPQGQPGHPHPLQAPGWELQQARQRRRLIIS
ncbi:unnamed protein product [Spirodela intermedia]|uniref:LOB domain-containing protein n=1 Tax=Spirodela intermedia TaxID=51605 RepID=A0A7I8J7L3_SPIIN|nr:unnamed protein product [Spirodela intermedia]CAA6665403.1 unnamed protein product [Spirodela intermedia]